MIMSDDVTPAPLAIDETTAPVPIFLSRGLMAGTDKRSAGLTEVQTVQREAEELLWQEHAGQTHLAVTDAMANPLSFSLSLSLQQIQHKFHTPRLTPHCIHVKKRGARNPRYVLTTKCVEETGVMKEP